MVNVQLASTVALVILTMITIEMPMFNSAGRIQRQALPNITGCRGAAISLSMFIKDPANMDTVYLQLNHLVNWRYCKDNPGGTAENPEAYDCVTYDENPGNIPPPCGDLYRLVTNDSRQMSTYCGPEFVQCITTRMTPMNYTLCDFIRNANYAGNNTNYDMIFNKMVDIISTALTGFGTPGTRSPLFNCIPFMFG